LSVFFARGDRGVAGIWLAVSGFRSTTVMTLGAEELSMICELIAVASLCSWVVCLTVGLGLCSADKALLMGVPGTLLGEILCDKLGWPAGPELGGHPVLPAFLGTMIVVAVFAYARQIRQDAEERKQVTPARPFRDWPAAALDRARP
jgi:uncharacterized membrane protein YeaQ/YmgE (transglycosylase-associated protein family)